MFFKGFILKKTKKGRKGILRLFLKCIRCLLPGLFVAAVGICALAFLYYKNGNQGTMLFYLQYAVLIAGAMITGFKGYNIFGGRGIATGFFCGLPLGLVFSVSAAVFLKTFTEPGLYIIVICTALFSSVGGIISANLISRK